MRRHPFGPFKTRVAAALGVSAGSRESIVRTMLHGHAADFASYWLQLFIAMLIATLGLVLGSTGVVIGAMLISPLMGPIVALGMGLAVGSPLLVLRSAARTVASIVLVVASAAVLTLLLPVHEVTPEIAARTTPTLLDLLVATGCALAAAFTTARPGSETTSSAAGTAIGISLVPPLCVAGFGLGVRQLHIAGGAALLFTANLCAILLFAVLFFAALGFDEVDVPSLEGEAAGDRGAGRAARRLHALFGSRYGPVVRIAMPLLLVGAVAVPLSRALSQVSWEVRVRKEVHVLLQSLPAPERTVRSTVVVEPDRIAVRLVIVDTPERALEIERDLRVRVAAVAGIDPQIDVVAVASTEALREVASRPVSPPMEPPRPAAPDTEEIRRRLDEQLAKIWPSDAGPRLGWRIGFSGTAPVIEIDHLGRPLGPGGEAMLAQLIQPALGREVIVRAHATSPLPAIAIRTAEMEWTAAFADATEVARRTSAFLCVKLPREPPAASARSKMKSASRSTVDTGPLRAMIEARVAMLPVGHGLVESGDELSVRVSDKPCVPVASEPAVAGSP